MKIIDLLKANFKHVPLKICEPPEVGDIFNCEACEEDFTITNTKNTLYCPDCCDMIAEAEILNWMN